MKKKSNKRRKKDRKKKMKLKNRKKQDRGYADLCYNSDDSNNDFDLYEPDYVAMEVLSSLTIENFERDEADINCILDETRSGPININFKNRAEPVDYFKLLFTDNIVQNMVNATNKYAEETLNGQRIPEKSPYNIWKNVTVNEMHVFVGLHNLISMAFDFDEIKNDEYFKIHCSNINIKSLRKIMSQDRFNCIMGMLKFGPDVQAHSNDILSRLKSFSNLLRRNFKKHYYPYEQIGILDSSELFEILDDEESEPSPNHYEVRICFSYDVSTKYVLDFDVFCNLKDTKHIHNDFSAQDVLPLVECYYGKGHSLFIDNWLPSFDLLEHLRNNSMNTCRVKNEIPVNMSFRWKRRKQTVVSLQKEVIVESDWSLRKNVTPLNKLDNPSKPVRWYKKMAFGILDFAVLNARVCYNMCESDGMGYRHFMEIACIQMIERYRKCKCGCMEYSRPCRLKGKIHFPVASKHIYVIAKFLRNRYHHQKFKNIFGIKGVLYRRWYLKAKLHSGICYACKTTNNKPRVITKTRTMCKVCNLYLCVNCFVNFHTYLDY